MDYHTGMSSPQIVRTAPFQRKFHSQTPIPSWWRSREPEIAGIIHDCRLGPIQQFATSPGRRPVHAVFYGSPEYHLRGHANFNSAIAAGSERHYWRRQERQRPVLMIVAGMHGHETEGMVAATSLLRIAEQGIDLLNKPQPTLQEKLARLRLVVVPLLNPDGRARVPYDGLVGIPTHEMHRVGQGTRPDGSAHGWPACKAVHPMREEFVGSLGGYFDDAGVNYAHDEFFCPMSPVTTALMRLVVEEAPDILLNLHSHECHPAVLPLHSVPLTTCRLLSDFTRSLYARYSTANIPHQSQSVDTTKTGGIGHFNVTSAFFHAGAALPVTFESPHCTIDPYWSPLPGGYMQILELHHLLFETAADYLLAKGGSSPYFGEMPTVK
jgi:hypothetical protein